MDTEQKMPTTPTGASTIQLTENTTSQPIPAEETEPEADPEPDTAPKQKVFTVSTKFHTHEYEYIKKVLEERQNTFVDGKPLTRDMAHLIRQFARFTLNFKKGMYFHTPENITKVTIDT